MSTCNCKAELEAALVTRHQEQNPDSTSVNASLQGYALRLRGNQCSWAPYMDVTINAKQPTKAGGVKQKKTKQIMSFSFCPFCGVKL